MKFQLYKNSQNYADDEIHSIREKPRLHMYLHNFSVTIFYVGVIAILIILYSSLASATLQDDFCTELNPNLTVSQCNAYWNTFTSNDTIIIDNTTTVIISNATAYNDSEIQSELEGLKNSFEDLKENATDFQTYVQLMFEAQEDKINALEIGDNESSCDSVCLFEKQLERQLRAQQVNDELTFRCLATPELPLCKDLLQGRTQISNSEDEAPEDEQHEDLAPISSNTIFELQKSISNVEEKSKDNERRINELETSGDNTLSLIAIVVSLSTAAYLFFSHKKQKDDAKILDAQRSLESHQERKRQQAKLKELGQKQPLYEE